MHLVKIYSKLYFTYLRGTIGCRKPQEVPGIMASRAVVTRVGGL